MNVTHMAPAALPQELIGHIIQYCEGDPSTLRNLALVSRGWLPFARDHLFSSITFQGRAPERGLLPFLNFINTGSSINLHVKNIKIVGVMASPLDVLEVVLKLPNLRSIIADSPYIAPPPKPLAQPVPHLERLEVLWPGVIQTSVPWRPLFDLVSGFASIGTLHLEKVLFWLPGRNRFTAGTLPPPTPAPARKTRVDTLYLLPRGPRFEDKFYAQIKEFIDVGNIRVLHLETYKQDRDSLQMMINSAENLKEFWIDFGEFYPRNLSLKFCKFLETMDIKISLAPICNNWDERITNLQENFRNILTMISSLPLQLHASPLDSPLRGSRFQSPLAHVRLGVCFPHPGYLEASQAIQNIRWSDLENTLRPFPQLQSVSVDLLLNINDGDLQYIMEHYGAGPVSELVKRNLAGLPHWCSVEVSGDSFEVL